MSLIPGFEEVEHIVEDYKVRNGLDFLAISATINGYHHFRTRSLMGFDMILECHREPENYFVRNALQIGVPVLRRLREVADVLVREDPPETVHSTRYCRQNYKKGSCYFVSTRRQSARLTYLHWIIAPWIYQLRGWTRT